MRALTILFTNNTLAGRAGSELWVRDMASSLLVRGHRPIAFSLVIGDVVAGDLRAATIPVVDDLGERRHAARCHPWPSPRRDADRGVAFPRRAHRAGVPRVSALGRTAPQTSRDREVPGRRRADVRSPDRRGRHRAGSSRDPVQPSSTCRDSRRAARCPSGRGGRSCSAMAQALMGTRR